MPSPKSEAELSPEWRAWIVENLLRGADNEEIVKALDAEGVPRSLTVHYFHTLQDLPEFQGALRATRRGRQLKTVLDLSTTLYSQLPDQSIHRETSLSGEVFYRDYYRENRPVHLPFARAGLLTLAGRLIIYAITSVTRP